MQKPRLARRSKGGEQAGAPAKVSLPILSEVRAAQGAHGLKLRGDFLRYRRYCTPAPEIRNKNTSQVGGGSSESQREMGALTSTN